MKSFTIYDMDGTEIGRLRQAIAHLGCSRATLYKISEVCEGGRRLTRYPKPVGKRGPDRKKRKQRPAWEPSL